MKSVSIIIVPRERYGVLRDSVQSVLAGLHPSISVVCVAGKAPRWALDFLSQTARKHRNFKTILVDRFVFGNAARILGLKAVPRGNDLVFIENDVVVRPGSLKKLLNCAHEEDADIVSPLILEGDPRDPSLPIHIAGVRIEGTGPGRSLRHVLNHKAYDPKLVKREQFDTLEYHCLFVSRRLLNQFPLDIRYHDMFAHLDLCFNAAQRGGKILMEPRSQAVFVNPTLVPIQRKEDLETFMETWNLHREITHEHDFNEKWNLDSKGPIIWGHNEWTLINKWQVFKNFQVLGPLDDLFWRLARRKYCPVWIRQWLEDRFVGKIYSRVDWFRLDQGQLKMKKP